MKIYRALESRSRSSGYFIGEHLWNLPGISCSRCKEVWATTGVAYPAIQLSEFIDLKNAQKESVVDVDEFIKLEAMVLDRFPHLEIITPGTSFGNLVGTLRGRNFTDFVPSTPWTLLMQEDTLNALSNSGTLDRLEYGRVQLKDDSLVPGTLFEAQLMPRGHLILSSNGLTEDSACSLCGRRSITLPPRMKVTANSIPDELNLFRLANFTTIVVATQKFVDAYIQLKLTGLEFDEIEIVEDQS